MIINIWSHLAQTYGLKKALIEEETAYTLTFNDLNNHIQALQAFLHKKGITASQKVALFAENHPRWVVVNQAVQRCGGIIVPRGSLDPAKELEAIYQNSDSLALITDDSHLISFFIAQSQKKQIQLDFILYIGEKKLQLDVEPKADFIFLYEDARRLGEKQSVPPVFVQPNDTAVLMYTSGTSGIPKGVVITHLNLWTVLTCYQQDFGFKSGGEYVGIMSLWHSAVRDVDFFLLSIGTTMRYVKYLKYMPAILQYQPDYLLCVPKLAEKIYAAYQKKIKEQNSLYQFVFQKMLSLSYRLIKESASCCVTQSDKRKKRPSLKTFLSLLHHTATWALYHPLKKTLLKKEVTLIVTGASANQETELFLRTLGIPVLKIYGMTETTTTSFSTVAHNPYDSVGQIAAYMTVKIVNPESHLPVLPGEKGLIIVRGQAVMKEYYKNPQKTAELFDAEGFLNTGDLGYLINKTLYLIGRYKDMIVLNNGENIEPQHIEFACLKCPYISQLIIAGQDKPYLTALIVPHLDTVHQWAEQNHLSLKEALNSPAFKKTVLKEINDLSAQRENFRMTELIKDICFLNESFSPQNQLMTHTLKLKRAAIYERYAQQLNQLYQKSSVFSVPT